MVDLVGRCSNVGSCSVAESRRVITLPEGSRPVCPKCEAPLLEVDAAEHGDGADAGHERGLKWAGLAIPIGLALIAGGVVAYKVFDGGIGIPRPAQVQSASALDGSAPAGGTGAAVLSAPAQAAPPPSVPQQAAAPQQPAAMAPPVQAPAPTLALAPQAPQPSAAPLPSPVQAAAAAPPKTMLLRLAGSDAVAGKLARRMASGYLTLIGDSDIGLLPGASDRTTEVGGMQTGQRETIAITSGSSASGFAALLRGSADMAMSVRKVSAAEQERLASLGDLTAPSSEIVVGLEGIAAVVSPANRVSALAMPQLRAILGGRLTDWSQLGGAPGPIHVYLVDDRGGTVDVPHEALLGQDEAMGAASRLPSEQAVAANVAADRGGIGFTTLGAAGGAKVLAVADAGAAPVAPTDLTISTESYPLSRRLYLYAAPGSPNLFVKRFAAYVSSAGGQAVVEAAGVVPLTVKAEQEAVPDAASERFRQLVAGATRLSVDFRFQPGSLDLDGRSLRDLDRLAAYLKSQRVSPSRVILAGFADNSGAPAINQVVSQRRAEAVSAALSRVGIVPGKTAMFGAELPVADNSTPEGRERNRRVEVYLAAQ